MRKNCYFCEKRREAQAYKENYDFIKREKYKIYACKECLELARENNFKQWN